ncbi:MAG: diguanylate cyclase/phosphodiesterase (GGDEF & EAL domains) with PAS/PAC sensor(s) [uncultured Rubrobacteraceae bacterium]|uniref:histidine kinase n=1 Tax=uncultured Rubrobacteraceae bacterium TaxID=349277 RepID=A0A6J4RFZ0_9ACTN|nr:MAG: diguanylate cyclase/phosphodiesterase (GGDEF & EAL domains) with PAS/PAC sensor(s) [uncultured Rubrobacteraceae bacterium]
MQRDPEENITEVLERITDDFFAVDREWRYTYLNEGALRRVRHVKGENLGRGDLLGRTIWEVFPETVGSVFYQKYHEAVREQTTVVFEAYSPLNGEWYEVRAYPSANGLSVYFQDVTGRKRTEEQLRYQSHLLENMQDAVLATDERLVLTAWNKGAETMFGWRAEEALGRKVQEVIPTEFGADHMPRMVAGLSEASPQGAEMVMYRKDGTPIHVDVLTIALRDEHGRTTGYLSINRDISERKRTEKVAEESRKLLDDIIEQASDTIFVKDAEGRYLLVNSAGSGILGIPARDLLGKRDADLHPPEVATALRELDVEVTRAGEPQTREEHMSANGTPRTYLTTKAPRRDSRGQIVGVIGIARDITERKQAEEDLRRSEERFRAQFEGFPIPTVSWRKVADDFELVDYNAAADRLTQGTMGGLRGLKASEWYANDPWIMQALSRCYGEGVTFHQERPWRMKTTGEHKHLRVTFAYVPPDLVMTHVEDITERKQAEAELARVKERFQSLVRHSSDIITVLSADGKARYQSPAIERVLGYRPDELVGENVFDYVHPEDLEQVLSKFAGLLNDTETHALVQVRFRHKDGSWRHLEAVGSNLLHDPGVEGVVVNSRDTTERSTLLEDQRRFMANAAHQLKTPITTIAGAAELLVTKQSLDAPKKRQLLDHVFSEARHMQRLSETLLRSARIGLDRRDPDLAPVDLTEAARLAARRFSPLAEVDLRVEGDGARALADPELLQEVLLVLLDNAAKHSGPDRHIHLRAVGNTITVEDGGTGISDADLPHVFERFYRGKGGGEGFGLGLSIARELVERMGGSIFLDSTEGSGTTARIDLPGTEARA